MACPVRRSPLWAVSAQLLLVLRSRLPVLRQPRPRLSLRLARKPPQQDRPSSRRTQTLMRMTAPASCAWQILVRLASYMATGDLRANVKALPPKVKLLVGLCPNMA